MKKAFSILLVLVAVTLHASVTPYEWEKNRTRVQLTAAERALTEIVLKQHIQYDYDLDNNQFVMYSTVHSIVYVNNTEAIQKHNRIVIPMYNTIELVDVKARVITKEGKVILFDKNNLKTLNEDESGNAYKIFAMEGVELESEIEYYFVKKQGGRLYDRAFLQTDALIKSSSFFLSCPKHLKFDFKSYNGYESVKADSQGEKNTYSVSMTNIPGLKKENFASFDANRKRIEFKLAYNVAKSESRIYTWEEAAKTFYRILTDLSKDETKALDKYISKLNDNPALPIEQRIRNIENQIKSTIQVNRDGNGDDLSNVASVIKLKVASREGLTKVFVGIFDKLKIECQPVITCNREQSKFDGDFDTWSYLDEYILYFPETKFYLSPYAPETRYPLIPPNLTANQGLFIQPFVLGNLKTGLGVIGEITPADYLQSKDDLDLTFVVNGDLTSSTIHVIRSFSGYNASFIAPYFSIMTQEQKQKLVEDITKQTAPDPAIKKWDVKFLPEGSGKLVLDVELESSHFIERAGPRLLLKVGELIGPQVEMYREDNRVSEIENDYNRGYDRLMKISIPKGYTVKNMKDLNLDVTYKDKDNMPYLFQSNATQEGDVVVVSIKEYYKQIFAPVQRYEDYRKVINAAADFNKVTLVLEKKK